MHHSLCLSPFYLVGLFSHLISRIRVARVQLRLFCIVLLGPCHHRHIFMVIVFAKPNQLSYLVYRSTLTKCSFMVPYPKISGTGCVCN